MHGKVRENGLYPESKLSIIDSTNMLIYGSPFLNLADDHTHSGPVDLYSSGGLVQLALTHSGQVEQ